MPIDMNAFARVGAQARLIELAAEMDAIHSAFPDLADASAARHHRPAATNGAAHAESDGSVEAEPPSTHARRPMSAAAKKAVSRRMKAYWLTRKAGTPAMAHAADANSEIAAPKRILSAEARARISAAQRRRWRAHRKAAK
jgi:hypothetical protein